MVAQTNPYEPPTTVNDSVVGTTRVIRVGATEINTVHVSASIWSGIRTFAQNDAGTDGPVHRGPVEFQIGARERHTIRIDVDGTGKVDAYLDGNLLESNLFSRLRIRIFFIVAVFILSTVALVLGATSLISTLWAS